MMSGEAVIESVDDVCARLEQHFHTCGHLDLPSHTETFRNFSARASVLVPLVRRANGEWFVLLTKRSSTMRSHPGDVALPGGKANLHESSLDAALRESFEEIGLDDVTVVGRVEVFMSRAGIGVTPYVAIVDEAQFKPRLNASEVDALFAAPLGLFLDRKQLGSGANDDSIVLSFWCETAPMCVSLAGDSDSQTPAPSSERFRVWGLTAFIILRVLSVIAPVQCRRVIDRERWQQLEFFIQQTQVRVRSEMELAESEKPRSKL
jgi:8-oxo-dGTP pyrophosphatase MutT (NUDIX family)